MAKAMGGRMDDFCDPSQTLAREARFVDAALRAKSSAL